MAKEDMSRRNTNNDSKTMSCLIIEGPSRALLRNFIPNASITHLLVRFITVQLSDPDTSLFT
jgi:hypothetical protein